MHGIPLSPLLDNRKLLFEYPVDYLREKVALINVRTRQIVVSA